jgi:plastocyanin
MLKQWIVLTILVLTLVACGGGNNGNSGNGGNSTNSTASTDPNMVLMNTTDFVPAAVTIPVDTSLTLKAEGFVPHFIANGIWQNGTAMAAREDGAPEVNNIQIDGGKEGMIGPFTKAGTFQFYCTIHPNMNLTVTVE